MQKVRNRLSSEFGVLSSEFRVPSSEFWMVRFEVGQVRLLCFPGDCFCASFDFVAESKTSELGTPNSELD